MKFRSTKNRQPHLGSIATETLARTSTCNLDAVPAYEPLHFNRPDSPTSIVNAMCDFQAVLDAIRHGTTYSHLSNCPDDPRERAEHLKSFGYYIDASIVGVCKLPASAVLPSPIQNPDIERLEEQFRDREPKSLAAGIDVILADLRESLAATPAAIDHHTDAIVLLYEYPRDPLDEEPGTAWLKNAQAHRACLRSAESAIVLANYIRLLGHDARAHTASSSDVDLNRLAVAAGLAVVDQGELVHPIVGKRFGLAAITTTFTLDPDAPLADLDSQPRSKSHQAPFAKREFAQGLMPFETIKRRDIPTTFIDEERIPRVPKRTDMFARSLLGELGTKVQEAAKNGHYVRKAPYSMAQRRVLGALLFFQDGDPEAQRVRLGPAEAAENLKAASYFLGADAVGISRCPDWTWYSHDAAGDPVDPPHDQAISMIIDQGFETMEGASGDDWIAVSQSMRAYLRFSLLGGVIAKQIRRLGYRAKAHTVLDGDVLQPPLLLLSGLGEVSRIGEVILNPYLGPRLKSGVVTTDLPLEHDRPIDFGLQNFCENCNKCARECPAGAITAGPKKMFNGYEIWKSDSQKCTTYRLTNPGGAMCGRCMKTCPWNLEGLFVEAPFRWAAMNVPQAARLLAKLDDLVGHGEINTIKKWWWDLEATKELGYEVTAEPVNVRGLSKDIDLKPEDQTLAVYPADQAPYPWPYPFPMDREKGIAAYDAMITPAEYKRRLAAGDTDGLAYVYRNDQDSPVVKTIVVGVQELTDRITLYKLAAANGDPLPTWQAGAHVDVVVAPEFLRQYSLCGDPDDRSTYSIAVLREDEGRGASKLMHRIFRPNRAVFISHPINHFELEGAPNTLLLGGGIGVTPMIPFAHTLHAQNREFSLHYSVSKRTDLAFDDFLRQQPWADDVHVHVSEEGTRADLAAVIGPYAAGRQLYVCGPDAYMDAAVEIATAQGFPEEACHIEFFSTPELPDYENHDFRILIASSDKTIDVPADLSATDALAEAGVHVDVKCSDGLCGVCKCNVVTGDVEHRDFVLSKRQRETQMILCQSRAKNPGGTLVIEL